MLAACAEPAAPLAPVSGEPLSPARETPVPEKVDMELAEAEPAEKTPLPGRAEAESAAWTEGPPGEADTEILMINVGKGDAILVRTGGKNYLIDGGKPENAGKILSVLKEEGVTRLDAVFLTHTDGDHTGCLSALTPAGIGVGTWYASRWYASPKKEEKHPSVKAAALSGQKVVWLSAGDTAEDIFEVLAPLGPMEDEDDNSLVMTLTTAYGNVLFTGDMEFPGEAALLSSGADIACDILKVPNHADDDTASEAFLRATGAGIALISTSPEEKPGTPGGHVTDTLARMGTEVFRTDLCEKGIRVRLTASGKRGAYCAWETAASDLTDVALTDADAQNDTVTLFNGGTASADIGGCSLVTERGGDLFLFPAGTVIPAGGTLTVGSRSSGVICDLMWDAKNILHNKKDDAVFLYDAHGTLTGRFATEP